MFYGLYGAYNLWNYLHKNNKASNLPLDRECKLYIRLKAQRYK